MRMAFVAAAAVLLSFGQPALAQVRDADQFQLVTGGLTVTLLSVEVNHVQVDNTIEVVVVLQPSRAMSDRDGVSRGRVLPPLQR